ncbi:cytochrome P450 [Salininema proteolyticum]|uniref:Cytochrome P450 n=1 Tax=Salininema proteolyticum TaxID=1607685 RepID=A0ABV8TVC3_9ACTN
MTDSAPTETPSYPMRRAEGCPFDPPPGLKALQESGPLARVRLWDGSTPWLATRYEEQRSLLADPRISVDIRNPGYPSTGPALGGDAGISFLFMDDPEHNRLRRMVTQPFTLRSVKAMAPAVQKVVDELIDAMLAGPKPADLVRDFALPMPSLVICDLLGVPYSSHEFFQEHSERLVGRDTALEDRKSSAEQLVGFLVRLVHQKAAEPGDDVMSTLAPRVAAGELTDVEAAQTGFLLLVAGHETTANMLALGTVALLEHPEQLKAYREADEEGVERANEELLRYLTISHNGRRRVALEDIEIAGTVIRKGEGVIVPSDIGNRDAEVFPDPDALNVGRDARRHMAFGFGVHQCLGQPLARLEMRIALSTLFRRMPDLALACDVSQVPFKHDATIYGVHELPVTW